MFFMEALCFQSINTSRNQPIRVSSAEPKYTLQVRWSTPVYQNIHIDETNILVPSKVFHEITLPLEPLEYENAKNWQF